LILVDTNVLLDLVTNDPDWSEWSLARLEEAALAGPICINDIIYSEISIRYDRIEDLDAMLSDAMIEIAPTPRSTLFLAPKPSCVDGRRQNRRCVPCDRGDHGAAN